MIKGRYGMDPKLAVLAMERLESDQSIGEHLNMALLMQLKKWNFEQRREYEVMLETLQIENGALQKKSGLWRTDWSLCEASND